MAPNVLNRVPSIAALAVLESALATLRISNPTLPTLSTTFKRHASHASQGRANGPKNGPGKRLGAKKLAGEYVIPGNILYKQRGTLWFPGDNCYLVSRANIYLKHIHRQVSNGHPSRVVTTPYTPVHLDMSSITETPYVTPSANTSALFLNEIKHSRNLLMLCADGN